MLTLLPALLTIFGRRAFWPFVPHTREWAVARHMPKGGLARRIVEGSRLTALLPVIGACLLVAVAPAARAPERAAPQAHRRKDPVAHLRPARPRDLQAVRAAPLQARARDGRDARGLEARRRRRGQEPGARDGGLRRRAARDVRRPRLLLHRPDHERQLPHRRRVGRRPEAAQPELPGRRQCADRHRRAQRGRRPQGRACSRERRWRRVGVRARGAGRARRADTGNARAAAVLDRGLRSGGPDP